MNPKQPEILRLRSQRRNSQRLRRWLWCVLVLLYALVMVGGITRLTDSGLSLTEWKPVVGAIPPIGATAWEEEFSKYRETYEYKHFNRGMSLSEFQRIYWWEWLHRILARIVGIALLGPLLLFGLFRRLEPRFTRELLVLTTLCALQGAVGWWMVKSGLWSAENVSHIRLAVHLTLAAVLFGGTASLLRGLSRGRERAPFPNAMLLASLILALAWIQTFFGGLLAGQKAGRYFNTWPLLDRALIPGGIFTMSPAWLNFFYNPKAVHFFHRLLPWALMAASLTNAVLAWRHQPASRHASRSVVLLLLVFLQFTLGVITLLAHAPFPLALAHQGLAFLLIGVAAFHWRGTTGNCLNLQTEAQGRWP